MPDHPNQPQQYDAVLGEQTPIRAGSAILGGLEGVNRHLDSAVEEQRIAALSEALKYGEAGLDLVILALQDESEKLRRAAYLLLRERTEPKVKQTLWEGVKRHLDSAVEEQRIAALSEALKYGEAGLDLVILALQDDSEKLQRAAYLLLRERTEPKVKQTLKDYNPWQFVTCLHTLLHPPLSDSERRYYYGDCVAVRSVAISRDGQTLVSAGGRDGLKVSNLSMSPIGQMTRTFGADPFRCSYVAISPDGETLVSDSTDHTIKIWHLPTGQLITTLVGHSDLVTSLAISQNGQTFVSGSKDGTIKVWGVP